jgi:hypothetical protein
MVDGVVHKACLRLEDSGESLEHTIRAVSRRRWFSRGGLLMGGAASLAVGGLLGGALEGIPVLLAPPAAASRISHVGPDHSTGAALTASYVLREAGSLAANGDTPADIAAILSSGRQAANGSAPAGASPGVPGGTAGGPPAGGGSGAGAAAAAGVGTPAQSSASTTTTTVPGLLHQVTGSLGQSVSQLPLVGSTVSGAVGALGGAASSLPATPSLPATVPGGSAPSGSAGAVTSGVQSTVGSVVQSAQPGQSGQSQATVQCPGGSLVSTITDCPATSLPSALGGL